MAFAIDVLLAGVLIWLFYIALSVAGLLTLGLMWGLMPIVVPVVPILYIALTTAAPRQATPGMRLFGLRLHHLDHRPVTFGAALIRAVLFYVLFGLTGGLAPLVCAFQRHRRGVHDLLSDTIVLRGEKTA